MSAFMNALREEGTKEDCLQQIGRLLDERDTYKARLAEAVEVMRSCRATYVENDDAYALDRIISNIDDFLAKLEVKP